MRKNVIADTEPTVALIDKTDRFHEWAEEQAAEIPTPYLTSETVIAEASYLLQNVLNGQQILLAMLEQNVLKIDFTLSAEVFAVQALMRKYQNVPMDLADACLVRMSERIENSVIFTLDSDFWVYLKNGKEQISLIIPNQIG